MRGVKNVHRIASSVYRVQPRLVEPDYAGACHFLTLKNRRRSLMILMTEVVDKDVSEVVVRYMGRYRHSDGSERSCETREENRPDKRIWAPCLRNSLG